MTKIILFTFVIILLFLFLGFGYFMAWPSVEYEDGKFTHLAEFGDSFGVFTSLFTLLAFAGLIYTILIQKEELSLQRDELRLTRIELAEQNQTMKIQRFENTFFNMLEMIDNIRDGMRASYNNQHEIHKGRSAIEAMHNNFFSDARYEDDFSVSYERFYKKHGEQIGHYFRSLYHIIKLVDTSDYIKEKYRYTDLVRAQLSRNELSLLFINCISDYGREKFLPLVKKYNLLKHLEMRNVAERDWTMLNEVQMKN